MKKKQNNWIICIVILLLLFFKKKKPSQTTKPVEKTDAFGEKITTNTPITKKPIVHQQHQTKPVDNEAYERINDKAYGGGVGMVDNSDTIKYVNDHHIKGYYPEKPPLGGANFTHDHLIKKPMYVKPSYPMGKPMERPSLTGIK